ncbi:hypothetical protein IMW75_15105 [Pseudomonas gregormendelii]|uniref:Uncharacterized protein n=2 Tax=Pseudomonas gregormendelii TaxID=1628277 RepID=A0ABS3AHV1_9PSED|nr:hypothetical protein [Pseudomonas gregormendelii]
MTDLNGGAFFDAEFVIGHGAAPYRKGQVLHSVFAAAALNGAPTECLTGSLVTPRIKRSI